MGMKKKAAEKVIKTIAKNVNVDKMLDGAIDKVTNSIEKGISNSAKNIQSKKEKTIEDIKNYKVESNSEDIINFFIEAKRNIKTKNIDNEEYNMWFLKIEEVYEKAQESISVAKDDEIKSGDAYRLCAVSIIILSVYTITIVNCNTTYFFVIKISV